MKRRISLATLLLLAALPLRVIAAEPAQSATGTAATAPAAPAAKEEPAPLFEQLDVNHDGYVTKEEARRSAEVTARFKELDADGDGRISAGEFRKTMQPKY